MGLKYLADENFPGDTVVALRGEGFDIIWIGENLAGIRDEAVLEKAMDEERILITFDKDFGELAFRRGVPSSCGIILFRLPPLRPNELIKFIHTVLLSRNNWTGHFSVVDTKRIRMRTI